MAACSVWLEGFQGPMRGSLVGCRAARKKAAVLTGCWKKSQSSSAAAVGRWLGCGCRQAVAKARHAQGRYATSDNQNLRSGQESRLLTVACCWLLVAGWGGGGGVGAEDAEVALILDTTYSLLRLQNRDTHARKLLYMSHAAMCQFTFIQFISKQCSIGSKLSLPEPDFANMCRKPQ